MPTAPKKTWGGQWYPQAFVFVAIFVTGGQESASKSPTFLSCIVSGNEKKAKLNMKQTILICALLGLTSCMVNYPMTTFYVKNTTNETLNFKASVIKQSSMGPHEMTLPFAVAPNDSVVARQVGFKKGIEPTAWFSKFIIFPSDSVNFNDPNDPANWKKTLDEKGRPVYTFNMTK